MNNLRPHQTGALADLYARWAMRMQEVISIYLHPPQGDPTPWNQARIRAEAALGELWVMPCRSGKTRAALTALYHWTDWLREWGVPPALQRHFSTPHLILVPTDLVRDVWAREWENVAPPWDWRARVSGPGERERAGLYVLPTSDEYEMDRLLSDVVPDNSVVVATYATLRCRELQFIRYDWQVIVADEIHRLKNRDTDWTQAAYKLRSLARLGLSATPFTNYVHELRNVLAWLQGWTENGQRVSHIWPSQAIWEATQCAFEYISGNSIRRVPAGASNPVYLYHKLRAEVMYSVTPADVSSAPEPVIIPLPIALSDKQAEVYCQLEAGLIRWMRENKVETFDAGPALTQALYLMELCADARQLDLSVARRKGIDNILGDLWASFTADWTQDECSSKRVALRWVLDGPAAGEQVLILTGFAFIANLLAATIPDAEAITGSTKDREAVVSRFKDGTTRIVVCTRAAWEGITLAAPYVVLFGFVDYTPGMVKQAIRRAWTMDDTEPTQVYDIFAPGTIEDWNRKRLARKDSASTVLTNGQERPLFDIRQALRGG